MKKQKKTQREVVNKPTRDFFELIPQKFRHLAGMILILIPLTIIFSPYLFDNLQPSGTDVVASKGETNLYLQWEKESGQQALWNPNVFGGMPIYPRIFSHIIHVDTFIWLLNNLFYWAYLYFFVGAIGLYFLLVYRKIPWFLAAVISIAFILLPDWQSLVGDGHYTKLRAVMILPLLILSFNYFFDKNNWLGTSLFALTFSWMIRTQHFQIVFYAILVLLFLFIYPFIKMFVDREFKKVGSLFMKFSVAVILTVMISAQPFLSIKEYTPHSTRGGNPAAIGSEQQSAKEAGGVSFEYATKWSLAPSEIMDFFIQRFHGGVSGEIYDGDMYPQIKGQQIPGYWGQKPFSGNYAYLGIIVLMFAVLGAIKNRKDSFVFALTVFTVFSLLLAFGRHFPELYKLFFYYVPYFSKFRAPAMMANISFIALLILAGYGLKSLLELEHPRDTKLLLGVFGFAASIGLAVIFMKEGFSYLGANESGRYDANTLSIIKTIRQEFLTADTIRMLLIVIFTSGISIALLFKKIKKEIFVACLLILILVELFPANKRAAEKIELNDQELLESNVFSENEITKFLNNQPKSERLLVLGKEFQSNHYSYFHPTINGYSAIKMQSIQDIIEHNLYSAETDERINWNVINMLNGHFIMADGMIDKDFLSFATVSKESKQILYINQNALGNAWFVKSISEFETAEDVIRKMNKSDFNPRETALVLANSGISDKTFSGDGDITLTDYTPNKISFTVNCVAPQLMVLSELHYQPGWKAYLNESEIQITKVNHLLRGVEVPAGEYNLRFEIHPDTYFSSLTFVWIGNILTLTLLGVGFFLELRKRTR